jgi:hypothetical protein
VQGKSEQSAQRLLDDARALSAGGAFAITLECVPEALAARITQEVSALTIGIGAGKQCDAQVLVYQDMLGYTDGFTPKFVKKYANLHDVMLEAFRLYKSDCEAQTFPHTSIRSPSTRTYWTSSIDFSKTHRRVTARPLKDRYKMQVVKTIQEVRDIVKAWRSEGLTVGLVPTMGYLHEGHQSLIARSVAENDRTVVSVFVNPIQFGPTEDLEAYPATWSATRHWWSEPAATWCSTLSAGDVSTPLHNVRRYHRDY